MLKKILNKLVLMKYFNMTIMIVLSLGVVALLSSFVIHLVDSPSDPNVDGGIEKITPEEVIQVNIYNACGEPGLASKARRYLRARGFDVVEIGNYKKHIDETILIDRVGDISSANKVANAIGLNQSMVQTEIDSSLYLRSTLVIGKDFEELNIFK